jgi:hypothetical protein
MQGSEDEVLGCGTNSEVSVKKRLFRLVPAKLFRVLGVKGVEFTITIHPRFDRLNLDFSNSFTRRLDSGKISALGFSRCSQYSWTFDNPDFSLLRRLLEEGKISANDRFGDGDGYWRWEEGWSLIEVQYHNHLDQ